MRTVATKTTYLEMRSPTGREVAERNGVQVVLVRKPSLAEYRRYYRQVGQDFHWVDRLLMSDDALRRIIHDDLVEIHLLQVSGEPAGYAELDRRTPGEVELAYFGLFPQFLGQGLGKYFLDWTLQYAWSWEPKRVWVHTCDLDHPAALPNYLKAGFQIYDEKIIQQPLPD